MSPAAGGGSLPTATSLLQSKLHSAQLQLTYCQETGQTVYLCDQAEQSPPDLLP